MFYKKADTINQENEDEIGIVDIDEDDGIDSDVLPSSCISNKETKTNRIQSNPKRQTSKQRNKSDNEEESQSSRRKNNFVSDPVSNG